MKKYAQRAGHVHEQVGVNCPGVKAVCGNTCESGNNRATIADSKKALDDDMAKRVWEKTEEITGLKK